MAKSYFNPSVRMHPTFGKFWWKSYTVCANSNNSPTGISLKYSWISITIGYLSGSHVAIIWVAIHLKHGPFFGRKSCISSPCFTCQGSTFFPNFNPLRSTFREFISTPFTTSVYFGISKTSVPGQITRTIIFHKPDDSRGISGEQTLTFHHHFWVIHSAGRLVAFRYVISQQGRHICFIVSQVLHWECTITTLKKGGQIGQTIHIWQIYLHSA